MCDIKVIDVGDCIYSGREIEREQQEDLCRGHRRRLLDTCVRPRHPLLWARASKPPVLFDSQASRWATEVSSGEMGLAPFEV